MRKTIIFPVAALIFAFTFVRVFFANDLSFTDQNQLADYLKNQKPSRLEFSCSHNLYDTLQRNDFRELFRTLARAGIDHSRAEVSFNNSFHYINLRNLFYTDLPYAECYSPDDVRRAIRELAREGSDFLLLCTDELITLLEDGKELSRFTAESGIESYTSTYSPSTGIVSVKDLTYFDVPFAAVKDQASFTQAVADFAKQGTNEFVIIFEPDILAKITENNEEMSLLISSSILDSYKAGYNKNSGMFHFSEVTYVDIPREICQSIEDVAGVIRRMGTNGIRDFELIFPQRSVFEDLYADNFALLYEAEARGGMADADLSYDRNNGKLVFHNAEIVPDAATLYVPADAIAYSEKLVSAGETDIHLFCTPELYDYLLGNMDINAGGENLIPIYDLVTHAGIFDYEISMMGSTHVISIHINSLFPGKAILMAVRNGNTAFLPEREARTLKAASDAAAAAIDPDPLLTAKNVHDWICANTIYKVDEASSDDDTSIGAILNGEANCDGYSDAFYLIGSLAGLNIRYQHGDSLDKTSPDTSASVSHVWNLVEIAGRWYMADVTWDDEPGGISRPGCMYGMKK